MNISKITQEVTKGNFQLETVLKLLAQNSDGLYSFLGKHYLVMPTTNSYYAEAAKQLQRTHYDGSALIQTTIDAALDVVDDGDTVFLAPKDMAQTDTDPNSYSDNLTISESNIKLIGLASGRVQGGLPQLKVGATTTSPILTIQAAGAYIANLALRVVLEWQVLWFEITTLLMCYQLLVLVRL